MKIKHKNNSDHYITQLKDCARLLAFSLAQHRKEHKQVSLLNALPMIEKDNEIFYSKKNIIEGVSIFNEAMNLVENNSISTTPDTELNNLRNQPRINVSSLIDIKSLSNGEEWHGHLSNISWGGLKIRTEEPLGNPGDELKLSLPYFKDINIKILAVIVRSWETGKIHHTAIRFSSLTQKDESKLVELLEFLLNEEEDTLRRDTRLAHRIDISIWDNDELKSTLEDISKGGMMITMPDAVEPDESILIQISGMDDAYSLNLRAHVQRCEVVELSGIEMHKIALNFEHPTEELRSIVGAIILSIMKKEIKSEICEPEAIS